MCSRSARAFGRRPAHRSAIATTCSIPRAAAPPRSRRSKEYEGTAQMFVRLKVVDRRIAEIETIVARVGDQRWFAPETLANALRHLRAARCRRAERHSRAELVAAADAYFTAVQTEGTPEFKQAPFDPALKRFENGQQTTNVTANPVSSSGTRGRRSFSSSGHRTKARSSRTAVIPSSTSSTAACWPSQRSGAKASTHRRCCSPRSSSTPAAGCARFAR